MLLCLVMMVVIEIQADYASPCPKRCRCNWSGGRMTADCSSLQLLSIPPTLHKDIQTLIMDDNPLGQGKFKIRQDGLGHLKRLSLKGCGLTTMAEDLFTRLEILIDIKHVKYFLKL